LALGAAVAITAAWACAPFPTAPNDDQLLEGPLGGLTPAQLAVFLVGDEQFGRVFTPDLGLGPIFVAASCSSCHPGDGKGHPAFGLTRFGRMRPAGFDPMRAAGGPQLQHRAVPGYPPESVPPGITGRALFLAPSVTGLGFLEALDDTTLLRLADPEDRDGDGISGRVQLVSATSTVADIIRIENAFEPDDRARHREIAGRYIGRFGRKASAVTLLHQTVTAYQQDMGLTTDQLLEDQINVQVGSFTSDQVADPEVGSGVVSGVVFYLKTLRMPPRRGADGAEVRAGDARFGAIGCGRCHLSSLRTGPSPIAPLDRVEFHPYTDLLLHDMGPELDDGYTEGIALTSEWRTTPLWGLGLADRSQGGAAFFLHDGRARSFREAIEFHGGEGAASREAFRRLSSVEQEQLLAFLRSL
jgi:CxxC motif-containing protein (DUF1111 family)